MNQEFGGGPSDDAGTVKVAENPPLLLGVTVAGFVGTRFPSKCMVTIAPGSKLVPVTVT